MPLTAAEQTLANMQELWATKPQSAMENLGVLVRKGASHLCRARPKRRFLIYQHPRELHHLARFFRRWRLREAFGVRGACSRFRVSNHQRKRQQAGRTYSSPKVIHRWRRGASQRPLPPPVNNFGGVAKMSGEQLTVWLNRKAEHAGPGRRIPHSNVSTFIWRLSLRDPAPCRKGILRTLRLQVQTCQRRTSISASIRQGRRAQCVKNHNSNHEYID